MSGHIRIKNAHFYAYHGALEEEQSIGGKFEIDVVNLFRRDRPLIETLASKIADGLMDSFENILKLNVRVRKRSVPVGGMLDYVEAEVTRVKNE